MQYPRQTGGTCGEQHDLASMAGSLAVRSTAQHLGRPKQHEATVRTGEQLRLQTNLRDQLRLYLQMTPTADAVLQLRDHPSSMLRGHFLILLVELRIQTRDRVLPALLRSRYIVLQEYLLL